MQMICKNCGARYSLPFIEEASFVFVCEKCMTRHEHKGKTKTEDKKVRPKKEFFIDSEE